MNPIDALLDALATLGALLAGGAATRGKAPQLRPVPVPVPVRSPVRRS